MPLKELDDFRSDRRAPAPPNAPAQTHALEQRAEDQRLTAAAATGSAQWSPPLAISPSDRRGSLGPAQTRDF